MAGVVDGQAVAAAVTNPAFLIKNADETMPNKLGFNRALSGTSIVDIQKAINTLWTTTGADENTPATTYSGPTGTILDGDDHELALSKLATKFSATTGIGHAHDGTAGMGAPISGPNIINVPLRGYIIQGVDQIGVTGSSTNVSADMTGKTPSSGSTVEGVVVTGPNNKLIIRQASGTDQDDVYKDSLGNIVYGRLTESVGVWTLSYYVLLAGVETAYSFGSASDVRWYYQELFNPLNNPPVYSEYASIPSDNATADVLDATPTQRGLVNTGSQQFAGNKEFQNNVYVGDKVGVRNTSPQAILHLNTGSTTGPVNDEAVILGVPDTAGPIGYRSVIAGTGGLAGGGNAYIGGQGNKGWSDYNTLFGALNEVAGYGGAALGVFDLVTSRHGFATGINTRAGTPKYLFTVSGVTVTVAGTDLTSLWTNGDTIKLFDLTGGTNNTLFYAERIISNLAFAVDTTFDLDSAIDDRTGGYLANDTRGLAASAEGEDSVAQGTWSKAVGHGTIASADAQFAAGQFNEDVGTPGTPLSTDRIWAIGYGVNSGSRADAAYIRRDGEVWVNRIKTESFMDFKELGSDPANPASTYRRLWYDSVLSGFYQLDSSGNKTPVGGANLARSGYISVGPSDTSALITFATPFPDDQYSCIPTFFNPSDSTPQFQPITVTAKGPSDCTVKWNDPVDSSNYRIDYVAYGYV